MNSKGKSKAFTGATGLFLGIIILSIYWPPYSGQSQPIPLPPLSTVPHIDSVAILEAQARRADSAALAIASEILPQAKKLVDLARRKPSGKPYPAAAKLPELLVRVDGQLIPVSPEVYRGYWIVDIDSLQEEVARQELPADMPVLIDTIVEHANQQISAWQKVKRFLTNPFRK